MCSNFNFTLPSFSFLYVSWPFRRLAIMVLHNFLSFVADSKCFIFAICPITSSAIDLHKLGNLCPYWLKNALRVWHFSSPLTWLYNLGKYLFEMIISVYFCFNFLWNLVISHMFSSSYSHHPSIHLGKLMMGDSFYR